MLTDVQYRPPSDLFIAQIRNPEPDALGIWHNWPKRKKKQNKVEDKSVKLSDMFDINKEMSDLNIPPFLQHAYINGLPPPSITSLRDWQKELIQSPDWRANKNCIVLVPTSGGKTVAAEIAIAQMLMNEPEMKALYALPFVSLASEKTTEFKARFFKHTVRPYYQNIGGSDFRRGSIAVCTFEKAHALLNSAIKEGYIKKFGLIVIDEIHMINEDQRGAVIESLILKCLLLRPKHNIRIIGLTATLNIDDCQRLSEWINGFSFSCQSRPSRIKHYFKAADGSLFALQNKVATKISTMHSIPSDNKQILAPIRSLLSNRRSTTILVFVNNRKQTVNLAEFIAEHLYENTPYLPPIDQPGEYLQSEREQLIQRLSRTDTGLDPSLERCVRKGVGFHHAGMLLEERKLIEEAAKVSTLSIIVATTTLSAGINIRSVGRVIIFEAYRYSMAEGKSKLLPPSLYTQMAGRAGRNESQGGDVIILGQNPKSIQTELKDALLLTENKLEDITPHLLEDGLVDRFYLQCLSTGLVEASYDGVKCFVQMSLQYFLHPNTDISGTIQGIISRLKNYNLISDDMKTTDIGRAIAESAMSIEEGLELKEVIKKVENGLSLEDEIHILNLCIPPSAISNERTPDYDDSIWELIIKRHENVVKMITGIDNSSFQRHIVRTHAFGGKSRNPEMKQLDKELDRIYFACLLQELIEEVPLTEIVKKYKVSRGVVQAIQLNSANFAGQTAKFCERIKCPLLGTALSAFRKRLDFGVQSDILPLLRLPSCTKAIARTLVNNHIKTPADVAEISTDRLASMIAKRSEPSDEEESIAKKLKEEASNVARSLAFLDTLEDYAIQNMMVQEIGINII